MVLCIVRQVWGREELTWLKSLLSWTDLRLYGESAPSSLLAWLSGDESWEGAGVNSAGRALGSTRCLGLESPACFFRSQGYCITHLIFWRGWDARAPKYKVTNYRIPVRRLRKRGERKLFLSKEAKEYPSQHDGIIFLYFQKRFKFQGRFSL